MCDQKHVREHSEMFNSDDVDQLSVSDESEPEDPPNRELDHGSDDDDDDSVPAAFHKAQDSFSLSGGCSAFSERSHSIFGCLDSVDLQTSSSLSQENTDRLCPQPPFPSRKTSYLLSSCPTPPKKRGVPDYLVHPERWTHYSLEEVTETSDQDNSKVAHSFLSSLRQERKRDSPCDIQQRMIFSRPKRLMEEQPADLSAVRGKERRMHLSHLEEEDEDDKGRQREKTEGRRTEKSEEKDKEEETDESGPVGRAEDKKRVQKNKIEESSQGFTHFRNVKAKNYRKNSGCEDS